MLRGHLKRHKGFGSRVLRASPCPQSESYITWSMLLTLGYGCYTWALKGLRNHDPMNEIFAEFSKSQKVNFDPKTNWKVHRALGENITSIYDILFPINKSHKKQPHPYFLQNFKKALSDSFSCYYNLQTSALDPT